MAQRLKISNAPGFEGEFHAVLIPGLHEVPVDDERELLTIACDPETDHVFVVPSRCVTFLEG